MGDLDTPRAIARLSAAPAARDDPAALWHELDDAWQEAFRQAWDALRTGNIAVGACVSQPDGTLVAASRNRVCDSEGPPGEMFGSSIAHAELNALARLPFRAARDLILTSTLQPCLQCHAAIRMAPIAAVRFAGPEPVWDGCGDFTTLAPWVARHDPIPTDGPRTDEIATFAVLLARCGPGHKRTLEAPLRRHGLGGILDLVYRLEGAGDLAALTAMTSAMRSCAYGPNCVRWRFRNDRAARPAVAATARAWVVSRPRDAFPQRRSGYLRTYGS